MITIKGFEIISEGDPSVGIFRTTWEIKGPFVFDDAEYLELFREKLKDAFEYISDDSYVETFEEIEERELKIQQ